MHMKILIFGIMIGFYILNFWIFPIINSVIFPYSEFREPSLHPIYMGMILLSGLIVTCTLIVLKEVRGKR
jgi:hypothetical protein